MSIRNYWIVIEVDGRKTKVVCSPQGKRGGFHMKIYQRTNGKIGEPTSIIGAAIGAQLSLRVSAHSENGGLFSYFHKVTDR